MSAVPTLSCVPPIIEAGSTVRFSVSNAAYPATTWTMEFALNNGLASPLVVTALASGTGFIVTLTAAQTAKLAPGNYNWAEIFTAISSKEVTTGNIGTLEVLPGIGTVNAISHAQKMVNVLEFALQTLAATKNQTVTINGQSYSRSSISDYQKQLTYWQARVIAENTKINRLRGSQADGSIGITFARHPAFPIWPRY